MYLGLDIGTSSVKALLMDESQRIVASQTAPLDVSRPEPGWSPYSAIAAQACRSARRTTVVATWRWAEPTVPPGRMNDRSFSTLSR